MDLVAFIIERKGIVQVIVFDLELVKRFRKGQLSQIVEIGACKVDVNRKEITDQFQVYITPKSGYISKSTRKFINMTIEDVKSSVSFKKGIELFTKWIGTDYYLCSWGRDDRLHFINECIRKKVKLDWLINYNDIQKKISKVLDPEAKNPFSLKNALEHAGLEPTGQAHRGIDDALNTAQLFIHCCDQIELNTNVFSIKDFKKIAKKQFAKKKEPTPKP